MDFNEWCTCNNPIKVIGHNCKAFDLDFINKKNIFYHLTNNTLNNNIIDTLALARELKKNNLIQVDNCKQETLARYFNIDYDAHSAIEDVQALVKIYQKMLKIKTPNRKSLGF